MKHPSNVRPGLAWDEERGPSWWHLSVAWKARAGPAPRLLVAGWVVLVVTFGALGMAVGALSRSRGGLAAPGLVDVTVHPFLLPAFLLALWIGPAWGAVPAWATTAGQALAGGASWGWSLLFGFVGPLEVWILWGSMVTLDVDPDVRRWRDLWRYLVLALVCATTSSAAVVMTGGAPGLPEGLTAWRGWVVGGFLWAAAAIPLLRRLGSGARGLVDRALGVPPTRATEGMLGPIPVALVLTVTGSLALMGASVITGALNGTSALSAARAREVGLFVAVVFLVLVGTAVLFTWELARRSRRDRASALRDPLTGCFNRRAFYGLFEKEADRSRRIHSELSVIFFDIDHFKQVNDRFGHEAGDDVLRQLAVRVRSMLRETDLLFRWGGEEFVVLLPHTTAGDAPALAERIRIRVAARPLVTENTPVPISVTLSLGTAGGPETDLSPDALVARADAACYKAKLAGRDRVAAETPGTQTAGLRSLGSLELGRH